MDFYLNSSFWLLKEMAFRLSHHSSKSSICDNFARHSLVSSGSDSFYSLFGAPEDYYHFLVEKSKAYLLLSLLTNEYFFVYHGVDNETL